MLTYTGHRAAAGHDVVAAGLILRRNDGERDRWLLLKSKKRREWGFPKGHQNPGETFQETAIRECAEETGIALFAIEGEPMELHYLLPSGRSKRVIYFPAVTTTEHVTISGEHVDHEWMSAKDVDRRLPHANVRSLFRAYLARLHRRTRTRC
jgi:8-oxo-dGTP pyrophosphatase MutT (NUDIX family)